MAGMSKWRVEETAYPAVWRVVDLPKGDQFNDAALEELLEEMFAGAEPEDIENFMRTLQRFGRQAAPVFQKALPGMMQGAVKEGMVAGPTIDSGRGTG